MTQKIFKESSVKERLGELTYKRALLEANLKAVIEEQNSLIQKIAEAENGNGQVVVEDTARESSSKGGDEEPTETS